MSKVIFLCKYGKAGASSRYRFFNYLPFFDEFDCEFVPLLSDEYLNELYKTKNNKFRIIKLLLNSVITRIFFLLNSSNDNIYIIEKELIPYAPFFIEKFLLKNKKYCLDYDDYVGATYSQSKILKFFLGNKIFKLVENSRLTTVGNKWYFDIFENHRSLQYLPTNIEYKKYLLRSSNVQDHDIFTLVWIGSKSTSKYLSVIEEAFIALNKKYKIFLKVIGGKAPFEHENIINVTWAEETEILELRKSDVGIMPLYDSLWEKGKCGFKLVQYMGVGLPLLASPSPANNEIIQNNGFICKDSLDWYSNIENLYLDLELRKKLSKISLIRVAENYSYEHWGEVYKGWIKSVIRDA